jgi:hypothetical protein
MVKWTHDAPLIFAAIGATTRRKGGNDMTALGTDRRTAADEAAALLVGLSEIERATLERLGIAAGLEAAADGKGDGDGR